MATEEARAALANSRKRRGVVRSSLTRIEGRVAELEGKRELSAGERLTAQTLLGRLEALDSDFRTYHFSIIDLPTTEQEVMDSHEDRIANLTVRINLLTARAPEAAASADPRTHLAKRLQNE